MSQRVGVLRANTPESTRVFSSSRPYYHIHIPMCLCDGSSSVWLLVCAFRLCHTEKSTPSSWSANFSAAQKIACKTIDKLVDANAVASDSPAYFFLLPLLLLLPVMSARLSGTAELRCKMLSHHRPTNRTTDTRDHTRKHTQTYSHRNSHSQAFSLCMWHATFH